jgi:flagellar assembly protein FliH
VIREDAAIAPEISEIDRPELRVGHWTRLGGDAVLGDATTESALDRLAEAARSAAQAQGYATGWSEGRRAAAEEASAAAERREQHQRAEESRRNREHQAVLARLDAVADALEQAVDRAADVVETRALALALELTEIIVGRTLATGDADGVRRALRLLADEPAGRVRLSPTEAMSPAGRDLADRGIVVVADPGLRDGDVMIETDDRVIDARITGTLERIRQVLR